MVVDTSSTEMQGGLPASHNPSHLFASQMDVLNAVRTDLLHDVFDSSSPETLRLA